MNGFGLLAKGASVMKVTQDKALSSDRRCRLGRHHYRQVDDDNPEMRGGTYLRCERCGKAKDKNEYGPMPPGQGFAAM